MPINIAFYFRGSAIFVHPHLSWVKEMTYFPFSHFFSFFCVIVELNLPSPPSCLRAQPTFWMPADVDSHFFFFVCGLHKRWWWWCVKYILLSRLFLFFAALVSVFVLLSLSITCLIYPCLLSLSFPHVSCSHPPYRCLSASVPSPSSCRYCFFFFFLLGRKK